MKATQYIEYLKKTNLLTKLSLVVHLKPATVSSAKGIVWWLRMSGTSEWHSPVIIRMLYTDKSDPNPESIWLVFVFLNE